MGNWTGTSMIASAKALMSIVEEMNDLNKTLMVNVSAYSLAVQDNVKEGTEKMIKKIDVLLGDIRKEIEERAKKVNEAGEKLSSIELSAKGKIESF